MKNLSERQLQCVEFVSAGYRYDQIAYELGTDRKVVENHILGARIKLKAKTLCHVVAIFVRSNR